MVPTRNSCLEPCSKGVKHARSVCLSAKPRFSCSSCMPRWPLGVAWRLCPVRHCSLLITQSHQDPVEAMLWAASQQGMEVGYGDPDEDQEELEDMLEDLEDVWMRNPAPPEWAEVTGVLDQQGGQPPSSSSSSSSPAAAEQVTSGVATITWQQLQQQLQQAHQQQQQQQQQQGMVILQVTPTSSSSPPPAAAAEVAPTQPSSAWPDPLPWVVASSSDAASAEHQQQWAGSIEQVVLGLPDINRDLAAAWQGKMVAVMDTGHHSCLAAAIRLSAVYRLTNVVLLQAGDVPAAGNV